MRNQRLNLIVATAGLLATWVGIVVRFFWTAETPSVPTWGIAALLTIAAVAAFSARRRRPQPLWLWTAVALTGISLVLLTLPAPGTPDAVGNWRRESSRHVAETLRGVGEEIGRLEDLSTSLATSVTATMRTFDAPPDQDRTAAFALLDSLARSTAQKSLAPGTAIGLQLFTPAGDRIAWAGWPQSVSLLDRMFITGGSEIVYTRTVSLYHILSHVVPITGRDSTTVAILLVDMPLEVDYRVNNRFLKSSSLADHIPLGSVARVSFDYYPPTGNLVERLGRFREMQASERARRTRMLEAARGRPEPAAPDSSSTAHPVESWRDSVMTYFEFPGNVEPMGEIVGDESSGLQGRVLVRSRVGNPLLNASAVGHPFSHYVEQSTARRVVWGKACALLALFAFFVQLMRWIPGGRSVRITAARAALFAAFMVALRYALLSFGPRSVWAHSRLLDPSVFATPTLGGIMRNTLDFAVTAVFLVVLIYGVVRIVRDATDDDIPAPVRRVPPWAWIAEAVGIAGVLLGACELVRRLTNTVVVNANPRLVGDSLTITDVSVVLLHVGLFLTVTGIVLAGAFLIWGLLRATGDSRRVRACAVALGFIVVAGILLHRWDLVAISALVVGFVVVAPRVAHREDLVSIGIVAFGLVVISSAAAYIYLSHDYDELRKGFVLEKTGEMSSPSDNWKVVILEDVLSEYADRHDIRQALRSPSSQDVERLAFDLWADSPLSLLGYSCAIHIVSDADSVISEFSVDMPYRARIGEGGERTDTPDQNRWAVLDLTRSTPQGLVRFYRGVLNVDNTDVYEPGAAPGRLLGKVIVDVPFFFGSLELAARTGPRTPEVLRNVQEGGVAPRVEEPEALLLAHIDSNRRVTESSSEQLAVGTRVDALVIDKAMERGWPLLRSASQTYRVIAVETPDSPDLLLAGFGVPSPARHLLRWSTLFSLYLFYALVLIVAVIALGAVPRLSRVLPTLTPGRRLGFQQKLLASFLIVALAPVVILGLFSVNFIKGRFVEESRDEASFKAFSARKAFVNLLHGELQFFLSRADLKSFVVPKAEPLRKLGGQRVVALYDDAALPDDASAVPVVGSVEDVSTEDLAVMTIDGVSYVGVFSAPLRVMRDGWLGGYYIFYARAVDPELLSEIAEQVGADVNLYVDGNLVASSREGLLAGGFISATMNADAFVEVSLLGSDKSLATEHAGSYDFQVAYLPVVHWRDSAAKGAIAVVPDPTRAAISVPLLFRPESYSLEVQRATSVVLGVFALLLAATIALGLVVARGVFEPMRELVAGTRRISRGDFNVRLREDRADEVGIVATAFNEMTERIAESQRTLEERRRYLEAILESIAAGVISTDAEGRIRTVNSAAERITGIPAADAVGRTAEEIARSGRAVRIFSLLDPTVSPQVPFDSGEFEIDAQGRRATVKYMSTRLETEGRTFGTVLVFEDLTELIQTKKLSAWVEMARQIAHEIKNPLTPIRISTQFMRRAYEQKAEEFDRIFREGTETIIQQVDVLKRIAGEFSSFGRMQHLDIRPQEIDALVRHIVTPYQKNVSDVAVIYENGISGTRVLADAEAVRKICSNLIENAMEAMGPKGGELDVRCAAATIDGAPMVQIVFRDSGPGLNDEATRRLFEPYFSTKTTGTGLGLAICRTLSREMGGDVSVRNASGGIGVEAILTLRRVV
jgi:PAS domain S-box-containing protein